MENIRNYPPPSSAREMQKFFLIHDALFSRKKPSLAHYVREVNFCMIFKKNVEMSIPQGRRDGLMRYNDLFNLIYNKY